MKTCPHGHPKTAEHGYIGPKGTWLCRTCQRARQRETYERNFRALAPHGHRVYADRSAR